MVVANPTRKTQAGTFQSALRMLISFLIPNIRKSFALMNPQGTRAKYFYSRYKSSHQTLIDSFKNENTRRTRLENGDRTFCMTSIATLLESNGVGRVIAGDIDEGGKEAVKKALDLIKNELGLECFGSLSTSVKEDGSIHHDGGHFYILVKENVSAQVLRDISSYIFHRLEIEGETYPQPKQVLRLPLQAHLRAAGGSKRFPVLFPDGSLIDPEEDPKQALIDLVARWKTNSVESILKLHEKIPSECYASPIKETKKNKQEKAERRKKRQESQSKYRPKRNDVIGRFIKENELEATLRRAGFTGYFPSRKSFSIRCPFHEDKKASLHVFEALTDRGILQVCRCYSSNCPTHGEKYLDAFNVFCIDNNLNAKQAVKHLSDEYGWGRKKEFRVKEREAPKIDLNALANHKLILEKKSKEIRSLLLEHSLERGKVFGFRVTPGGGKTRLSIEVANIRHKEGLSVAISVPTHSIGIKEWSQKLDDPFIIESRANLCTCHSESYINAAFKYGYYLPSCQPECPYKEQFEKAKGKQVIFQHNHLHLMDGDFLAGFDLVFIDEGIVSCLLPDEQADLQELLKLYNRLHNKQDPENAKALYLLNILIQAGGKMSKKEKFRIGDEFIEQLLKEAGGLHSLKKALKQALETPMGQHQRLAAPKEEKTMKTTGRIFFAQMLKALEHDIRVFEEGTGNPLLAWGSYIKGTKTHWGFVWTEKRQLLSNLANRIDSPAVLLLDASAQKEIYEKLLEPWEYKQITIDIPISPMVKIIQCGVFGTTRKAFEQKNREQTFRKLMYVHKQLELNPEGAVIFKDAEEDYKTIFGGETLHYGGQRGSNLLSGMESVSIIGSPTVPPDSMLRKAMALYSDEAPISTNRTRVAPGYYKAQDRRLEQINQMHTFEELRQSIHRPRPIRAEKEQTILVVSSWPLEEIGISPHQTVTEMLNGNSSEWKEFLKSLPQKKTVAGGERMLGGQKEAFCKPGIKINTINRVCKNGVCDHLEEKEKQPIELKVQEKEELTLHSSTPPPLQLKEKVDLRRTQPEKRKKKRWESRQIYEWLDRNRAVKERIGRDLRFLLIENGTGEGAEEEARAIFAEVLSRWRERFAFFTEEYLFCALRSTA